MFPDRDLQLRILKELKTYYPENTATSELQKVVCSYDDLSFIPNLFYLHDHGLILGHESKDFGLRKFLLIQITVNGIDFLADDGGLSAILNKVHIKFDEDDLSKLLENRLEQTDLPSETKKSIMDAIKSLPAEGIKAIYTHLLSVGLSHVQDIPQLIEHILHTLH